MNLRTYERARWGGRLERSSGKLRLTGHVHLACIGSITHGGIDRLAPFARSGLGRRLLLSSRLRLRVIYTCLANKLSSMPCETVLNLMLAPS